MQLARRKERRKHLRVLKGVENTEGIFYIHELIQNTDIGTGIEFKRCCFRPGRPAFRRV